MARFGQFYGWCSPPAYWALTRPEDMALEARITADEKARRKQANQKPKPKRR